MRLSLERDAFPSIGEQSIGSISAQDCLAIVKAVEKRGALDVAARVAQRLANVFQYGVLTGKCANNTARDLRGVIKQRKVQHRAALARADIPEFIEKLASYDGTPETRLAIRLLMLTFVRPGELRGAQWSEFDFRHSEWRVPPERMKMGTEHIVPLSKQALELLEQLKKYTSW